MLSNGFDIDFECSVPSGSGYAVKTVDLSGNKLTSIAGARFTGSIRLGCYIGYHLNMNLMQSAFALVLFLCVEN